jgi:hypothetical protein
MFQKEHAQDFACIGELKKYWAANFAGIAGTATDWL